MRFEFRTLSNPPFEQISFSYGKFEVRLLRWHKVVIRRKDASYQFALIRMTRFDNRVSVFQFLENSVLGIEPQFLLPRLFVWTMARKATVGEQGTDLKIEINALGVSAEYDRCGKAGQKN